MLPSTPHLSLIRRREKRAAEKKKKRKKEDGQIDRIE
jgi:hypothetical protein